LTMPITTTSEEKSKVRRPIVRTGCRSGGRGNVDGVTVSVCP
jgi:hypothetical protein